MSLIATSQKELADSLGIGERTFAAWLKEGCPGEARYYVVSHVVQWARENKWCPEDDPRYLGVEGEANLEIQIITEKLEKLKRENQLADFKINERGSKLVDVSIVEQFLMGFAGRIRDAIETIQKKYGPDSCSPIRRALERIEKELDGGALDISSSE